jgi:hypothetical protein
MHWAWGYWHHTDPILEMSEVGTVRDEKMKSLTVSNLSKNTRLVWTVPLTCLPSPCSPC